MNAVFDDVNGLQSGIRDFKRPFNTKNVVLADGSCDNLSGNQPLYWAWKIM